MKSISNGFNFNFDVSTRLFFLIAFDSFLLSVYIFHTDFLKFTNFFRYN